ncbi:MAG: extracellular solute-binding protein [Gemmatimonadota bacterium]
MRVKRTFTFTLTLTGTCTAALLIACVSRDGRAPLIVYSPHGKDLLTEFEKRFEAMYPQVDVQWLDMGSQSILDRVRSEQANPQAHVWWGAPAPLFESAAAEGLLEPYVPSWAAALPDYAKDANGTWHGTYITPEVVAFNATVVKGADIPRDWDDVLDPKWQDKVLIRDPLESGTMRTIFGMIMYRSIRTTGDTAAGWQWLRRLDAQTKEYVLNPTLLYQKLARQEGLITLWDMPDIEELKARTTMPLDYSLPTSGTPLPVDAVAIVKGATDAKAARLFVDYVGGDEGILLAARQFVRLPARSDIPEDSLPERLRDAKRQIKPEPMDWALIQKQTPAWMRYWDAHVRGRGRGRGH